MGYSVDGLGRMGFAHEGGLYTDILPNSLHKNARLKIKYFNIFFKRHKSVRRKYEFKKLSGSMAGAFLSRAEIPDTPN